MEKVTQLLNEILDVETVDYIIKYISELSDKNEVFDYLQGFLGIENAEHKTALQKLCLEWNLDKPDMFLDTSTPRESGNLKADRIVFSRGQYPCFSDETSKKLTPKDRSCSEKQGSSGKKRSSGKFVPLFSDDGKIRNTYAILPGRNLCSCQASKHRLVNNCLKCGRVICEQEGSGPCLFCGELVATTEELDMLNRGSKKGEHLRQKLMFQSHNEKDAIEEQQIHDSSLNRAIEHKNRLLEFDRTSVRRTKVIDDELDYFAADSNTWLSPEERSKLQSREEELRAMRHVSRSERKINLDFAGRRVLTAEELSATESSQLFNPEDEVLRDITEGWSRSADGDAAVPLTWEMEDFPLANPEVHQPPVFVQPDDLPTAAEVVQGQGSGKSRRQQLRLQDGELQQMRDEGLCLSMHQPWASLLVAGIKIHEGRSWYTPHRGRLWIAATARVPERSEIEEVETFYRSRGVLPSQIPMHYPVGCLLGTVMLDDCLQQEAYRQQFPNGESDSDFVFICSMPCELLVKFPVKGQHKIYKLESHVHQSAKRGLKKVELGT